MPPASTTRPTTSSRSNSSPSQPVVAAELAGKIEQLLLDETPIIFAYFYDYLSATAKNVTGVYPTAQGQFFLWNAAKM